MTLQVGMKTWSGNGLERITALAKIGDFTEVMIEPDVNYDYLEKIDTKWVVHCGHMHFGFNPANRERWERSKHVLECAQEGATFLGADKIIVHLGYIENESLVAKGVDNMLEFFKGFKDKRILAENSSHIYFDKKHRPVPIVGTPDDTKTVLKKTKYGFCMDMAHAFVASHVRGVDEKKDIMDFLKLKPKHFHVLDSTKLTEDTHVNLLDGILDVEFFRDAIKKYNPNAMVSLETPYNLNKNKQEIAFMKL